MTAPRVRYQDIADCLLLIEASLRPLATPKVSTPDTFTLPLCRCFHPLFDHAKGKGSCENGSGCGGGCSCQAFRRAIRPWRCDGTAHHAYLGPDEDGDEVVSCPTCKATESPLGRAGQRGLA